MVEILVVLAITGLITAGMINFMISQSQSYSLQEDIQEMEQNARVAIDYLTGELQRTEKVTVSSMAMPGDRITLQYDADGDGALDNLVYRFNQGTSFYSNDESSAARISMSGTGTQNSVARGYIASFVTQDLNMSGSPDTPMFQVDNPVSPNVVTVTIIARTRRPDPNYTRNNGYRQIVLTRRVVLRNM